MALRIIVIIISVSLINFSIVRLKADVDMKTSRRWFESRDIELALQYNKSAIKWNPTEIKYYYDLNELEKFLNGLLSNPDVKKIIVRRQ